MDSDPKSQNPSNDPVAEPPEPTAPPPPFKPRDHLIVDMERSSKPSVPMSLADARD